MNDSENPRVSRSPPDKIWHNGVVSICGLIQPLVPCHQMTYSRQFLLSVYLAVSVCFGISQSEAQVMSEQSRHYHRVVSSSEWVYEIIHEGTIHQTLMHRRVYRTPLPLLAILTDPKIANDLEIVDQELAQRPIL